MLPPTSGGDGSKVGGRLRDVEKESIKAGTDELDDQPESRTEVETAPQPSKGNPETAMQQRTVSINAVLQVSKKDLKNPPQGKTVDVKAILLGKSPEKVGTKSKCNALQEDAPQQKSILLKAVLRKKNSKSSCGAVKPSLASVGKKTSEDSSALTTLTGDELFLCHQCNVGFLCPQDLKHHWRSAHMKKFKFCPKCGQKFRVTHTFQAHLKKCGAEKLYPKKSFPRVLVRMTLDVCKYCRCPTKSEVDLAKHLMEYHLGKSHKPYECGICEHIFSSPFALRKHLRRHAGILAFQCEHCSQAFTVRDRLHLHLRSHVEWNHKCQHCSKTFHCAANLKTHQLVHLTPVPLRCMKCEAKFDSEDDLETHLFFHDRLQCHLCEEQFFMTDHYKTHMSSHTEDLPYPCVLCDRKFPRKELLKDHQLWHVKNVGDFICKICGEKFAGQLILMSHYKVHSGGMPHHCSHCGAGFADKTNLKKHMRTHLNAHHLKCGQCDRVFTEARDLERHQIVHTKEKPFKCPICPSVFTLKETAKKHARTVHVDTQNYQCGICMAVFTANGIEIFQHLDSHPEVTFRNPDPLSGSSHGRRASRPPKPEPPSSRASAWIHQPQQPAEAHMSAAVQRQLAEGQAQTVIAGSAVHTTTGSARPGPTEQTLLIEWGGKRHRVTVSAPPGKQVNLDQILDSLEQFQQQSVQQQQQEKQQQQQSQETQQQQESMDEDSNSVDSFEDTAAPFDVMQNVTGPNEQKPPDSDNVYQCGECRSMFPTIELAQRHMDTTHAAVAQEKSMFQCGVCEATFSDESVLRQHLHVHTAAAETDAPTTAEQFDAANDDDDDVTHHSPDTPEQPATPLASTPAQPGLLECSVCWVTLPSAEELELHMETHENFQDKPFRCEVCKASFKHKTNFLAHIAVHTGVKTFDCPHCDKKFVNKDKLSSHLRTHAGVKTYACDLCPQKFRHRCDAEHHRSTHVEETVVLLYRCTDCGASFNMHRDLKIHTLNVHGKGEGPVPFECEFCGNVYRNSHKLIAHRRKHTGEKPFTCELCGKVFAWQKSLKDHMQIHNSERKREYQCVVCQKWFFEKYSLTRHLRRTHKTR